MTFSPLKKAVLLVVFGVGCGIVGIVTYLVFPVIMRSMIQKKLYLIEGTEAYGYWKDIPVPIYLHIYLFNVTNPMDVYARKSKPILKELGPYTFREQREKVDIGWNENGTLSYRQIKRWYFRSDLSTGFLDDKVTTINVIMMAAAAKAKQMNSSVVNIAIAEIFGISDSHWFTERTVRELLFEGYTDKLFNFSKTFAKIPFDKFGWFYGRNGTDDGAYTVFTGTSNMNELDEIDNFNGFPNVTVYDPPCNMISGTAGDLWSPFRKEGGKIAMFVTDICRTIHFTYIGKKTIHGIEAFRYWADNTELDNGKINPANKCFCNKGNCLPSGGLDVSRCKLDAPAVITYPHFLYADSVYSQGVIGMKPDPEKHQMYIDVQPKMGIPLSVAARMQINIIFEGNIHLAQFKNVSGRTYFPVLWFSETAFVTDEIAAEITQVVKTLPLVANVISYFMIGIGCLLVVTAFIYSALYTTGKIRHVSDEDTETSALATEEENREN